MSGQIHIYAPRTRWVKLGRVCYMTCSGRVPWIRHHVEHELVNMVDVEGWLGAVTLWRCPVCKATRPYKNEKGRES